MSIIGIVWFSLSFICVVGFSNGMNDEAVGWGMLGMLYAIPYSIVGIVQSNKKNKIEKSANQQLIELAELKEKEFYLKTNFKQNDVEAWAQLRIVCPGLSIPANPGFNYKALGDSHPMGEVEVQGFALWI